MDTTEDPQQRPLDHGLRIDPGRARFAFAPACASEPDLLTACRLIELAEGHAERMQLLSVQLHRLGFDWMGAGSIGAAGAGGAGELDFHDGLANGSWVAEYFSRGFTACDPRLAAFARSNLPYVWDHARLARDGAHGPAAARLPEFVAAMDAAGLRSGVFFGVPSLMPGRRWFVSLASRRSGCAWISDTCIGAAVTLGLTCAPVLNARPRVGEPMATEAARDHGAATGRTAPERDISDPQRRIIDCLKEGMSDKQIAYVLNISRHNVDYHMRQLRRRFGARNRLQLVQRVAVPAEPALARSFVV